MKTRKAIVAITALALLTVMMIPAFADISNTTWIGYTFSGHDDYYGRDVVAYETGTTAVLVVTLTNNAGPDINISKVWVSFDWGSTYSSAQVSQNKTMILKNGNSYIFTINFTVPSTSVASNLYLHQYVVNATFTGAPAFTPRTGNNFAVYSSDQADAMNLKRIITSYPSLSFESAQAQILWNEAANETSTGDRYYIAGNFAAAKQSYSNALNDKNQAWAAEQSYLTMLQDLQIQQTQAQIRSLDAMTSFFNGLSTMWVLFGIGWVLLGIGYIIKHLRSKRETSS